jgi:hypothetical protein
MIYDVWYIQSAVLAASLHHCLPQFCVGEMAVYMLVIILDGSAITFTNGMFIIRWEISRLRRITHSFVWNIKD